MGLLDYIQQNGLPGLLNGAAYSAPGASMQRSPFSLAGTDWSVGFRPPPSDALGGAPRFTDFAPGSNIEDRRADPNQLDLGGMATQVRNAIFGRPALPEIPPTELARQLGYNDIKIVPNVGQSALDELIGSIQDNWYQAKSIGRALRNEFGGAKP